MLFGIVEGLLHQSHHHSLRSRFTAFEERCDKHLRNDLISEGICKPITGCAIVFIFIAPGQEPETASKASLSLQAYPSLLDGRRQNEVIAHVSGPASPFGQVCLLFNKHPTYS